MNTCYYKYVYIKKKKNKFHKSLFILEKSLSKRSLRLLKDNPQHRSESSQNIKASSFLKRFIRRGHRGSQTWLSISMALVIDKKITYLQLIEIHTCTINTRVVSVKLKYITLHKTEIKIYNISNGWSHNKMLLSLHLYCLESTIRLRFISAWIYFMTRNNERII